MEEQVICPLCRIPFWRDQPWKKICLSCFIEKKQKTNGEIERLKAEIEELKKLNRPDLSGFDIMELIKLTHPDKHDNSELSNRVTRALLAMR